MDVSRTEPQICNDHVDAELDRIRKRPRLSEEPLTPTQDDAALVDAVMVDASDDACVEIVDLSEHAAPYEKPRQPYCTSLTLKLDVSPQRQLEELYLDIERDYYIDPIVFEELGTWIQSHLESTRLRPSSHLRRDYQMEQDFFDALSKVLFSILNRLDLFDRKTVDDRFELSELRQCLEHFYHALAHLSARMVATLTKNIDDTLARRDSGTIPASSRHVASIQWLSNLAQVTALRNAQTSEYFQRILGLDVRSSVSIANGILEAHLPLSQQIELLDQLLEHHDRLNGAWEAIGSMLSIIVYHRARDPATMTLVMDHIHVRILPAVVDKQPRMLPEIFHEMCITVAKQAMDIMLRRTEITPSSLYDRYIKGDDHALLPPESAVNDMDETFNTMADQNVQFLVELLSTAWTLQTCRRYLTSEIMDVRSIGVLLLSRYLIDAQRRRCVTRKDWSHSTLQYICRYIRNTELVKYIFGPCSHASLVTHSQQIMSFVVDASLLTTAEIEHIWRACTTSVESDFVIACYDILIKLVVRMDMDQLGHLLDQYVTTPMSRLGREAVILLPRLFDQYYAKWYSRSEEVRRTAAIAADVFTRAYGEKSSDTACHIANIALNELRRYTTPEYKSERCAIFADRVPDLISCTSRASASVEILLLYLRSKLPVDEVEELLTTLSTDSIVNEMEVYQKSCKQLDVQETGDLSDQLNLRLELIVRLTSVSCEPSAANHIAWGRLYAQTVGLSSLDDQTRQSMWLFLLSLLHKEGTRQAAKLLLDDFVTNHIPSTEIALLTPASMDLIADALYRRLDETSDPSAVLASPLWHKLVEVAQCRGCHNTPMVAAQSICWLLFDKFPSKSQPRDLEACYASFSRHLIDEICQAAEQNKLDGSEITLQRSLQSLNLLEQVLNASRTRSPTTQVIQATLDGGSKDNQPAVYRFQLQLRWQPKHITLQTSLSTRTSELNSFLAQHTGASQHNLHSKGKVIELKKAKLLSDLGIWDHENVMLVHPRYDMESDLDIALRPPNAVDQELHHAYDKLYTLLSGHDRLAADIFTFLSMVPATNMIRADIISAAHANQALTLSEEHLWQTCMDLYNIKCCLQFYTSLGVYDQRFVSGSIWVLNEFICHQAVRFPRFVVHQAIDTLILYLSEKSQAVDGESLIPEPEVFIDNLLDHIVFALDHNFVDVRHTRGLVACQSYKIICQAIRLQISIWKVFEESPRFLEVHQRLFFDHDISISTSTFATIEQMCNESRDDFVAIKDAYLQLFLDLTPQAMSKKGEPLAFFGAFGEIYRAARCESGKSDADQRKREQTTSALITQFWTYKHNERLDFPAADVVMIGFLDLLRRAVLSLPPSTTITREFGLNIYNRLLFPSDSELIQYPPLVHPGTRRAVYMLVRASTDDLATMENYLEPMRAVLNRIRDDPTAKFPGLSDWTRPVEVCAGLTNLGMTCYMNSLLQQLFANIHFRQFILSVQADTEDGPSFLLELQRLFARLQDDRNYTVDTTALASTLNIQVDNQEDVHGFYAELLSRLESSMPDDKAKTALNAFFTGKLISQVKGECGHVSPKVETFVDLSMVVKNKTSLQDSLDEFVQGEPMEGSNQYKCLSCDPEQGGRLVNAMKRACPEELPDNLTFCLKRFSWEAMLGYEGKVNDRFEFPENIDMSRYTRAHLEDPTAELEADWYELVGVTVHQGSLQLGHYWSFVMLRNGTSPRQWVKAEDSTVTICEGGIAEVQSSSFGGARFTDGSERVDNAYVLFYQRSKSIAHASTLNIDRPADQATTVLPPRIQLPENNAGEILISNQERFSIATMFDDEVTVFLAWIMQRCQGVIAQATKAEDSKQSDGDSPSTMASPPDSSTEMEPVVLATLEIAVMFIQRVAVCDPRPREKVSHIIQRLRAWIEEDPAIAIQILQLMLQNDRWLRQFCLNTNGELVIQVFEFLQECLMYAQMHDLDAYHGAIRSILRQHSSHLNVTPNLVRLSWQFYLTLPAQIASRGSIEAAMVLDSGYLRWALDMLYLPKVRSPKKRQDSLGGVMAVQPDQVSAIYHFLSTLLSDGASLEATFRGPVLDEVSPRSPGDDMEGVRLNVTEFMYLTRNDEKGMLPWITSASYAFVTDDWEDFEPGKFVQVVLDAVPAYTDILRASLQRYIEQEDSHLPSVLMMTLHFFNAAKQNDEIELVMRTLAANIVQWQSPTEFLGFIHIAFKLQPRIVLDTTMKWMPQLLTCKNVKITRGLQVWMVIDVLNPQPSIEDDMSATAGRARVARGLIHKFADGLFDAADRRHDRRPYNTRIKIVRAAGQYLDVLIQWVKSVMSEEGENLRAKLGLDLITEYDEAKQTVRLMRDLEASLRSWETTSRPRGSVGGDSFSEWEEEEEATEDDEWVDGEIELQDDGGMSGIEWR